MKLYIRADASRQIGSGHVMRCLVLADRLRTLRQAEIVFLCRELPGNLIGYIRARGHRAEALPVADGEDFPRLSASERSDAEMAAEAQRTIECLPDSRAGLADWLIVDHYALDGRYEQRVRPFVKRLMVIDDLADRPHACDVLLDPNFDSERGFRYRGLVGRDARLLIGSQYALLRPAFAAGRPRARRDGNLRRLLVSFGGVDATGEIDKALEALAPLLEIGLAATVLAGKANPRARRISERCAELPHVRFYDHVEDVAAHMLEADAAIGAGGTSTWERCCLGLPTLVITTAANQEPLTEQAARHGAVRWLGRAAEVDPGLIREAVMAMIRDPAGLARMSARAMELTDGQGADRIVKELDR